MLGIFHLIALGLFIGFAVVDTAARARLFPAIPHWKLKGIAFALLYFAVVTYAPLMWDGFLGQYQLVDGSVLPFWAQVLAGFFLVEALTYAWHRTMHNVQPLWRWFHQMHHSAERVDIWGAFYFHPFDMMGWAMVGSLALVLGIGLTPEAAIIVSVLATFCTMFQHTNFKTPQWLGYIVTRPESHSVHHERGVHAYNYGDIPIFDMLLGTFRNPKEWNGEAGFFDGSSEQIVPMLIGKEIA
ncbi:fatty acid hydroxylase [Altererythrobacter salegens]|uniref:Fatty acid hydroxylase n=1 Tax=Croceibacterium salegens TaxID=1737568 RepID=A0A6I4SV54_9SPHN|nr:sterol desaturase family protein [Croceibacterium salegens]MXO58666.1 fatty acid hydroxylase [Croceibacterium salegens]